MNVVALRRRVAKLEGPCRRDLGPWFVAYGRDAADIERQVAVLGEAERAAFVPILWPSSLPLPASRWLETADDLADDELDVLVASLRGVESRMAASDQAALLRMSDTELLAVVLDSDGGPR